MKKNIKIKDVDCLAFAGSGDENIKVIEKLFDSDIVLRGNELLVNGTKEEINKIQQLINNIIFTINRKKYITPEDINILAKSKNGIKENKIFDIKDND